MRELEHSPEWVASEGEWRELRVRKHVCGSGVVLARTGLQKHLVNLHTDVGWCGEDVVCKNSPVTQDTLLARPAAKVAVFVFCYS